MKMRFRKWDNETDLEFRYYAFIYDDDAETIESVAMQITEEYLNNYGMIIDYEMVRGNCLIYFRHAKSEAEAKEQYTKLKINYNSAKKENLFKKDKNEEKKTDNDIQLSFINGAVESEQIKEPKKKSESQAKAEKKYFEKLEDIKVRVPKGYRDTIKEKAAKKGLSMNAYILYLIDNDK